MLVHNTLSVNKTLNHSKFALKVLNEKNNKTQNTTNSTALPNYSQVDKSKIAFMGRTQKQQADIGFSGSKTPIELISEMLIKPLESNHESIPSSVLLGVSDDYAGKSVVESIKQKINADFVTISDSANSGVVSELCDILDNARSKYLQNGRRTVVVINDAEKMLGMSPVYAREYADSPVDEKDLRYLETLGNNTRKISYFKSLLDHVHEPPQNQSDFGRSATTILMTSKTPHLIHPDLSSRTGKVKTIIVSNEHAENMVQESRRIEADYTEIYNAGDSKLESKNYIGAMQNFTRAIELNPNSERAYGNRGICKCYLGDFKGAIPDYTRAIELNPARAMSYKYRGFCKYASSDYKGALEDYAAARNLYREQNDAEMCKKIDSMIDEAKRKEKEFVEVEEKDWNWR